MKKIKPEPPADVATESLNEFLVIDPNVKPLKWSKADQRHL